MNTPILKRFNVSVYRNLATNSYDWIVYDYDTLETYGSGSEWLWSTAMDKGCARRRMIEREWPDCQDQTLNTELKYRKTITSSCGRLKVTESL